MRVQLRIVAGSLRGRKVTCRIGAGVRPTPDMVREALFNILGEAVPGRAFIDLFAGTGVIGIEALSRGASGATFVERDAHLVAGIREHLQEFGVAQQAQVVRADVYRWARSWEAPTEAVNVFVSPPFADFQERMDPFIEFVKVVREKLPPGSVLVIQGEKTAAIAPLLENLPWEQRAYGRNLLLFWRQYLEV